MTSVSGIAPVATAPLGWPQSSAPIVIGKKGRAKQLIKKLTKKKKHHGLRRS